MIWPERTESDVRVLRVPGSSPASSNALKPSASVWPVTLGTATWAGWLATVMVTRPPIATGRPARGSWAMTVPWGAESVCWNSTRSRRSLVVASAWASVLDRPTKSGVRTVAGVGLGRGVGVAPALGGGASNALTRPSAMTS